DRGAHAILRALFYLKIGARVVKLFKNNLGRAAAHALMDWLVVTPIAVLELHLSHNFIPREGAVDILKAIAYNTAYPIETGRGRVLPLWLRLEQNMVVQPDELVKGADAQMKKIREASGQFVSSGPMLCECKDTGCRSDFCSLARPGGHCPLAQLTYLSHQRDARVRIPAEAQAWQVTREPKEEAARWRMQPAVSRDTTPAATPTNASSLAVDVAQADAGAAAA
ncbi:unnamed protein product, partial [Polarella glacialis]